MYNIIKLRIRQKHNIYNKKVVVKMIIKCKAKDLMRELAILQLRETRLDDIKRINELLKIIKL